MHIKLKIGLAIHALFLFSTYRADPEFDPPVINVVGRLERIEGFGLKLSCSGSLRKSLDSDHPIYWKTPISKERLHFDLKRWLRSSHSYYYTHYLKIDSVTFQDAGKYECFLQGGSVVKKTEVNITVHDRKELKLELIPVDLNNKCYEIRESTKNKVTEIKWTVNIDAFPEPFMQWMDDRKNLYNLIDNTDATKVLYTRNSTSLSIRPQFDDSRNYTLTVNTYNLQKNVTYCLIVQHEPLVKADGPFSLYYIGNDVVAEYRYILIAYPKPNASCTFYKNFPSQKDNEIIVFDIPNNKMKEVRKNIFHITPVKLYQSGVLDCMFCNTIGCDSILTFYDDRFFLAKNDARYIQIFGPKDELLEGQDVVLKCELFKHMFEKDSVRWVYEFFDPESKNGTNDKTIVPNSKFNVSQTISNNVIESTLIIRNITVSDSAEYKCSAAHYTTDTHIINYANINNEESNRFFENMNEFILNDTGFNMSEERQNIMYDGFRLKVIDPVPPKINYTNMNFTKITINLDKSENLTLLCLIDGKPNPVINWFKNEKLLKESRQFKFLNDTQKLQINHFTKFDDGMYCCLGINKKGSVRICQEIEIIGGNTYHRVWILSTILLFITFIAITVYFVVKMKSEKKKRRCLQEANLYHFESGQLQNLNPELTIDDQAELLPYDTRYEFPKSNLKFGKVIGNGAFGVVVKAEAKEIITPESITPVAVKTVKKSNDFFYIRSLVSELKIMVYLGRHLNIVNLMGACTKNISDGELFVILEFCRFGNLHNYLIRHRKAFVNQIDQETGKLNFSVSSEIFGTPIDLDTGVSTENNDSEKTTTGTAVNFVTTSDGLIENGIYTSQDNSSTLSNNSSEPIWRSNYQGEYQQSVTDKIFTQDLLSWAYQVARGMEYLATKKILHGDLAARNVLLSDSNVVKICDFGLAKNMFQNEIYQKSTHGLFPVKWMAIESISDRIFSTQSDIWSFGVFLWELFTLGQTPYPGLSVETVYDRLVQGQRLDKPKYCFDEMYNIMIDCWKGDPNIRPTFSELVDDIGEMLNHNLRNHYENLNARYVKLNHKKEGEVNIREMVSAPTFDVLTSPNYLPAQLAKTHPKLKDSDVIYVRNPRRHDGLIRFEEISEMVPMLPPRINYPLEPICETSREYMDETNPNVENPYLAPINIQQQIQTMTESKEESARNSQSVEKEDVACEDSKITE